MILTTLKVIELLASNPAWASPWFSKNRVANYGRDSAFRLLQIPHVPRWRSLRSRSTVITPNILKATPTYFATGFGRTWNFTTFGLVPLPPSWCQGVYIE
jgi:hypothetical protein